MTKTISTSKLSVGDFVVGFNSKVSSVSNVAGNINVVFDNGYEWNTHDLFETTILV